MLCLALSYSAILTCTLPEVFLRCRFLSTAALVVALGSQREEATFARRRFCSTGMRQGGDAVCQAVSRALLQYYGEMNFNTLWCHCSDFGEGISPRMGC